MSATFKDIADGKTGDPLAALDAWFPPKPAAYSDWEYRDVQWMPGLRWNDFLKCMGDGNFTALAFSQRGREMRGQFLISPRGIANLLAAEDPATTQEGV